MKYIRTKDGQLLIPEWGRETNAAVCTNHGWVYKNDIINQADTIEELCDEFISVRDNWHDHWDNFEEPRTLCSESDVYGAIWTKWGLKYVAKMNEDGVLCLL